MLRNKGRLACGALLACALGVPWPARAQRPAQGPVAARDLPRGAVLAPADIAGEAGAGAGAALVGWVTRRVVSAGEALREPTVAPPILVQAGAPVELVWLEGAVELRLRGRSMASAGQGERVNVRVDTRRRFEGVVVGPGVVRLEQGRQR